MPRRVVIIGAGGVGGWLCSGMVKMLEYKDPGSVMVIVDGDTFEQKNFERQAFNEIGNKAEVRAEELSAYHAQTFIVPQPKWVVSDETFAAIDVAEGEDIEVDKIAVSELLNEGDAVFCVVDNFAARKIVFDAATQYNDIDVFTGGNDDNLFCSVYHYKRREGRNITDPPSDWHAEYDNPPDRNPGELGCAERAAIEGGTQLLATNMTVAALLLGRAHHLLFEDNEDTASEIFLDLGVAAIGAFDRSVEVEMAAATTTQNG